MIKYIAKRIALIILIVLAVIFIVFILLYSLPASNVRQMPVYRDGDALDSVFTFFNAGDNIFTKYLRYCYNVFIRFEFGHTSSINARLVREFSHRVPNTLLVLACGVGATLIVGIPLGVYSAVHKNKKRDRIINAVTLFFSAIPNFTVAMVLALVFSVYLRLVPVIAAYTSPVAYILPTLAITLGGTSLIARTTRASMLDVLEMPYITALRSKGLGEFNVLYRHAFKNAMVPVISVLGGFVSQMLLGTFVVERFFNIPGLGSYMFRSVSFRDHVEILGCAVIISVLLATTNIAADVLYAYINPQIRLRHVKDNFRRLGRGVEQ